ncbi:hypothetical protein ACSFA2_01610 [Variovorax sp. LT2P21]|uniref:hypothetical protein n=1 Tax=Variovorax sp. LT2P21 TaxID=3443731 RepID=UPI003F448D09
MDRLSRPEQASTPRVRPAPFPWEEIAVHLGQRWWQRHPANAAAQLARPALARLAAAHPATLIAGAASVGALAMLARPWRFLSITAVAAALLKSSDVADWVTLLASSDNTNKNKDEMSTPRKDRR